MKLAKRLVTRIVIFLVLSSAALAAEQVIIVGWNAESGQADPDVVASRIASFQDVDIWGICELYESWAGTFEQAAENGESADYQRILGTTGRGDRLLILFDTDRFELIGYEELHSINPSNRVRSPLVAHFRIRSSGDEFKFMVNHLYRTNDPARHQQSSQLNDWAEQENVPVIAVGDYNYDWRVTGGDTDHDLGYDLLTEDGVFEWLRPASLARTQYSPRYPASVLDFVFLTDDQDIVTGTSEIIVEPGDFPDDDSTPDHRPIRADLTFDGDQPDPTPVPSGLKRQILQRITELEQELAELWELVQSLPD